MNPLSLFAPFAVGLLALTWLFPLATGPTPAVMPGLFSVACAGLALGVAAGLRWASGGARGLDAAQVLAASVLAGGLISVGIGLIQYFGLEKPFTPWLSSSFKGESFANLRQKNQFATLTMMAMFACAYFCARPLNNRWMVAACCVAALMLGAGNAIAASRTGVAELVLACLVVALWAWRSGQARALLAVWVANVLGFLAASALLPLLKAGGATILERSGMGAEGCHSRLLLWQNVWQLSLERPWSGWGWGSLKLAHYQGEFGARRFCEILDNAHNLPLHVAVELGLPVAGLMCAAIFWFIWRTWPATVPHGHGFGATHMACGMLGVVLLHSMLEYPLWYGPFQIAFALSVWLLWRGRALKAGDGNYETNWRLASGFKGFVATIFVAFSLFASWDYWRVSQIYTEPEHRAPAYRDDTLNKIRGSWLFAEQVDFADLAVNALTAENAAERWPLVERNLKHSPEPRVIEAVLLGADALGKRDLVRFHRARFAAAFPAEYAAWAASAGLLMPESVAR